MNININLGDKGAGGDAVTSSAPSTTDATDSGASKALSSANGSSVSSAPSASSGTMDIGGPPQWLSDAINKKSDAPGTASAAQQQDAADGGAGPSANSFK